MSAHGAGKMADGVIAFLGLLLLGTAALVAIISLVAQLLGPIGSAFFAAGAVYLIGALMSQSLLPTIGLRIGSAIGAGIGAFAGAHVYQNVGGFGGALLGAAVTGVLAVVLVGLGFLISTQLPWPGDRRSSKKS